MDIGSVQAASGAYGRAVYKFGFNTAVSTDRETIWDGGGVYQYPTTDYDVQCVSSSASDTIDGVGAQKITIEGLDENWLPKSLSIDLNGITEVVINQRFIRVFRAFVTQSGTSEVNVGNILVKLNDVLVSQISAGSGQTLMAVYTIPVGYIGYITDWSFSTGSTAGNKYLDASLLVKKFGEAYLTKSRATVSNSRYQESFPVATIVNQKDDIEIRANTSSGTDAVSGMFTVLMKRI